MNQSLNTEQPLVCISVCTRQRPNMLTRLIESFFTLRIPPGIRVNLEVVENDTEQRSKELVESFSSSHDRRVSYHFEPNLGIPLARNRCIREAAALGASFIAFVDDDEWFTPDWLENIWQHSQKHDHNAVIQGIVISCLDDDSPAIYQRFFQRPTPEHGSPRNRCFTYNLLMPMTIFEQFSNRFDESRPLAGGTDSKLFRELHVLGVPMYNCVDAVMYERVPRSRANLRWLSKRFFRIGLTLGHHREVSNSIHRFLQFINVFLRASKYGVKSLFYYSFKRQKGLKCYFKCMKLLGVSFGLYRVQINSYSKIQGD